MKHFLLTIILLPFFTFCGQQKEEKKETEIIHETEITQEASAANYNATYYLIRHAEKDRTNPKNQDPSLDIHGMQRAKRWATYFETIRIDDIYATNFIRTKQTVSFIAQQKIVSPKIYDQNTIYSEDFLKATNGKNILIVGHSNTIPFLANKLIGEEKFTDMDDGDNSTLFKVTINGTDKKVEVITVN